MNRLGRLLFNLAAGVSLVLCVAFIAAATRSGFVSDQLHMIYWVDSDQHIYEIAAFYSQAGTLVYHGRTRTYSRISTTIPNERYQASDSFTNTWQGWLAFGFFFEARYWFIKIPYWSLVLLTALPTLFWYYCHSKLHRREEDRRCIVCGYDLRATPERCPECGVVPEAAKGAAG